LAVAFAAVFATASFSNADMVDMRFLGTGHGRNVRVTIGNSTFSCFAGQLRHDFSNGTGAASILQGEVNTYCTDLYQHVSSSVQRFTVLPVASAPVGGAMGADKAAAVGNIYNLALGTQLTSSTSNDMAAAFQLAVWEIVTDFNPSLGASSLSLSTGGFRATQTNGASIWSSVQSILNGYLSAANNSSFGPSNIAAISSGSFQDQLVTIPAPGPAALAGVGLLMIGKRRRR